MKTLLRAVTRPLRHRKSGRRAYRWFLRSWQPAGDLQASRGVVDTMRLQRQLVPVVSTGPDADRIVVVAPHPDDELIGPGGTILRAATRGAAVRVLYLTSGKADEAAVRRAEAEAVCARFGFEARFCDHASHAIPFEAAIEAVASEVRQFRPGALFLPFLLDDHEDHRRASEIVATMIDRVGPASQPEIWAYQVYSVVPGNVVVDITDLAERKADAISLYRSQMAGRDWAHYALGLNAFNSRFMPSKGRRCYGEMFFVVPADEYADLCRPYFQDRKAYSARAYRTG